MRKRELIRNEIINILDYVMIRSEFEGFVDEFNDCFDCKNTSDDPVKDYLLRDGLLDDLFLEDFIMIVTDLIKRRRLYDYYE